MHDGVTELGDAQRATFDAYVREWIALSRDPGPITESQRAAVVAAIRDCYEAAALSWHGNVFWAGSPASAAAAASVAAVKCHEVRHPPPPPRPGPRRPWYAVLGNAIGAAVGGAVAGLVLGALVGGAVGGVGAYVHVGGFWAVLGAIVGFAVGLMSLAIDDPNCLGMVLIPLAIAFATVIGSSIGASLAGENIPWPGAAIGGTAAAWAVYTAPLGALTAGVIAGILAARKPASKPSAPPPPRPQPPVDTTADQIRAAIPTAVEAAVQASVSGPVLAELEQQITRPIRTVTAYLHAAAGSFARRNRSHDLAGVSVYSQAAQIAGRIVEAVQPTLQTSPPGRPAQSGEDFIGCVGGGHAAAELAAALWLHSHTSLELPDDLWSRAQAYQAANRIGWWWPHADFVVISEPPVEQHLDPLGRPHRTDGPALRWPDGCEGWFLDGKPHDPPPRDDDDDDDMFSDPDF